jgi:hypothetical protein
MSMPTTMAGLIGSWSGTSRLIMHGEEPRDCDSTATVAATAQGRFALLAYTWSFDGQPQDGTLLLGQSGDPPTLAAAWIDSWHMGDALMRCEGAAEPDGSLSVRGSYSVPGYPDWGWRIAVQQAGEGMHIDMWNISPEGVEYPAVEARYSRVAGR